MNKKEIIEKINGMTVETFFSGTLFVKQKEVIELIKQLDDPKPLKLKDIISRMKQLFPLSRSEWIDEILNEFGEDYGSIKYREGYEQGKLEGAWVGNQLKDADKTRQELNKPVVQQFVADWYEENKDAFEANLYRYTYNIPSVFDGAKLNEFERWFLTAGTKPFQTLVNMHQFGYEVEKENWYRISMPKARNHKNHAQILCEKDGSIFWCGEWYPFRTKFTRKQLEEANFGWVFDCEGIEIEEVE